jgi:hypothetical protein
MASIKKRVERLEQSQEEGCVFLWVFAGETAEEVWERYLAQHPEADKAEVVFCIKAPIPRPPGNKDL